jgi:hypothetical protein
MERTAGMYKLAASKVVVANTNHSAGFGRRKATRIEALKERLDEDQEQVTSHQGYEG